MCRVFSPIIYTQFLWHSNLALASWLEHRTLNRNNPSLNLPFRSFGNFVHSKLPQLTRLYKKVLGNIQWWVCERVILRAVIAARLYVYQMSRDDALNSPKIWIVSLPLTEVTEPHSTSVRVLMSRLRWASVL